VPCLGIVPHLVDSGPAAVAPCLDGAEIVRWVAGRTA